MHYTKVQQTAGVGMRMADSLGGREIVTPKARELYLRILAGEQPTTDETTGVATLLNLGLLRQDGPSRYVPVDPAYIGDQLTASFQAEAARQSALAAAVQDEMTDLVAAFAARPSDSAGLVEFVQGTDAINARLGQVLASCAAELMVLQPGGARRREILEVVRERDLETLRRGVTMRTIYHADARAGAVMDSWVGMMTESGAQIRTLDEPFQRMIVIDHRVAVIPGGTETAAYIVHDAGLAAFLATGFERDWARSAEWVGEGPDAHLRGRQERILSLLATGLSVKAVASKLGLSQRSLAAEISTLKEHYGVESQFQLACAWMAGQGQGSARSRISVS